MKILFISNVLRDFLGYYPLGILYLSSSLKKNGHHTLLLESHNYNNLLKQVHEYNPDIIAYSATTGSHQYYTKLNRQLKKDFGNNFISVIGGPHPTFSPQILHEEGVDAICRGEGEEALVEFVEKIEKNEDHSSVLNFWVKTDNTIIKNGMRPKIANINTVPFPDLDLLGKKNLEKYQYRFVLASRGCPFKCTYCFNAKYNELYGNRKIIRVRDVGNLIDELLLIKNSYSGQTNHIKFVDDNFVIKKSWLKEFAEGYKKHIGIPFSCFLRPELVNEEKISLLKKAGCFNIIIGIESGSEEIRKMLLGRLVTNETTINAAKIIKDHNISLTTQNIIGLPGENLSQAMETVSLNMQCNPDLPDASIFMPYPGTKLGNYCIDNKLLNLTLNEDNYTDSIKYTANDRSILNIQNKLEKENLSKLFSLMVKYPKALKIFNKLITYNFPQTYRIFSRIHKGYLSAKRYDIKLFSFSSVRLGLKMVFGKGW